jgi:tetratricopeptide (TPR) repeat protein/predicted Ser/Thr protein kinase
MNTERERLRRLRAVYDALLDADAQGAEPQDPIDPELRAEAAALMCADPANDLLSGIVGRAIRENSAARPPPAQVGPYRLLELIGEGGMGSVWLGERVDGEFRRRVAVKLIRGVASPMLRERLRRERQLLAELDHPHIARLLDGGTSDAGEPWLAMEYVQGQRLGEWALAAAPSMEQRLRLFVSLCEAVHYAHQRLVVHCDVKPSNVLVRADGTPMLLDFGIARLLETEGGARTATRAATPAYASPEQLLQGRITVATDVYGLGMVLFELLAGAVPPRRGDAAELERELPAPSRIAAASADQRVVREAPRLRGDLDSIVRRAVRCEPAQRYPSAAELAADARAWLEGRAVAAAGGHWRYLTGKFVRRHPVGVTASVAALIGLVGLSILLGIENRTAREALATAEREALTSRATVDFLRGMFDEIDPRRHPGRQLTAAQLLESGSRQLDQMRGASAPARSAVTLQLAALHAHAGRPTQALALATDAKQLLGDADPGTAQTLLLDRVSLTALADLTRWAEFDQRIGGALTRAELAKDPLASAELLLLRAHSARDRAEPGRVQQDLDRAEALFGEAGPAGAAGRNKVAFARAQLAQTEGHFDAALTHYRIAAVSWSQALGEDHPDTLAARFGEAITLNFLGRTTESIAVYEDLLPRRLRVFGEFSDVTAETLGGLSTARKRAGDYAAAIEGYREAIRISEVVYAGADHVSTSNRIASLAVTLTEFGAIDEALELNARAQHMRERLFGVSSPWVAMNLQNRAHALRDRGDYAAASAAVEAALEIRRAQLEPQHFLRLLSEATALELDALQASARVTPARIAELERVLQAEPPVSLATRIEILRALSAAAGARSDFDAQAAWLDAEQGLLLQRHPDSHPLLGQLRLRRAQALAQACRLRESRTELEAAAQILAPAQDPRAPALAGVAGLHAQLDRPCATTDRARAAPPQAAGEATRRSTQGS